MLTALRHALRNVARAPGFSALLIAIIALGIGANTAIFSVVRSVLLRPLPLHEPERLVRLYEAFDENDGAGRLSLSPQMWVRWRELNTVFTDIGASTVANYTLTADGGAQRVPAAQVSANFFSVLGLRPILGRDFQPGEDRPGAPRVALVGHGFWQRELGGSEDVLGRVLQLDGESYTIVGVLPAGFRHPYRAEVWTPLALEIDLAQITGRYLYTPARLKPGVTLAQADTAMRELCARIATEYPMPGLPKAASISPLHELFVRDVQPKLLAISAAALFVLLIAGANVASLLFARMIQREGDTGVRLALGASRARLVGEALAYSLTCAVLGALAGTLLASWLVGPLLALSPLGSDASGGAIREFDVTPTLDGVVLGFSVATTLLIGVSFGLLPAWRASQSDVQSALRGAGRSGLLDRGARRMLGLLVVTEVALAVVLLVGTGLMIRSFRNFTAQPWGFATANRLVFDVSFTDRLRPQHEQRVQYVEEALLRLRTLPGVRAATATTPHQMFPAFSLAGFTPEGITPPEARGYFITYHRMVFPGYFRDAGIPLVMGRDFEAADFQPGNPQRVIVSRAFAERFWPGQDPIGKRIKRGRPDSTRPYMEIIGVVADTRAQVDADDGDVVGNWYLPYAQHPNFLSGTVTFILDASVPADSLAPAVRTALAGVDPNLAVYNFNTLERMVSDAYTNDRFALLLVSLFGGSGLLLAAIGLYALLAFQVARRTRELGVRAALGATAADIVGLVFREGGRLVGVGLVVGAAAAWAGLGVLRTQLHDVSPADPWAYLLALGVLALAASLACWLPARRATRINPIEALRAE